MESKHAEVQGLWNHIDGLMLVITTLQTELKSIRSVSQDHDTESPPYDITTVVPPTLQQPSDERVEDIQRAVEHSMVDDQRAETHRKIIREGEERRTLARYDIRAKLDALIQFNSDYLCITDIVSRVENEKASYPSRTPALKPGAKCKCKHASNHCYCHYNDSMSFIAEFKSSIFKRSST